MRIYNGDEEYKRKPAYRSRVSVEPRKREKRSHLCNMLVKYMKLYCRYTKLAGFRYFVEEDSSWFDRLLWTLVYAMTVPALIYTIIEGYQDIMENPCFSSIDAELISVQSLDFPGVSICSINRINRSAAMEMANELFQANVSRFSVGEIFDMIMQLGDLYDSHFIKQNRSYRIDHFFDHLYGSYDLAQIMKRLTPQCSKLLAKCRFHDEEKNCSEMFQFRKTQDGFCCTFNYATKADDIDLQNGVDHRLAPLKVENLGEDGGMSVVLNTFLDEYAYPIFPISGFKVTIFNPHDYPDMTSGGVIEMFVSPQMQKNVDMVAIVSYSTTNVIPYALQHRHCVFAEEMASVRASYTYSDCIVDCKIADILHHCSCVPFYLPNRDRWSSVIPNSDLYNDGIEESSKVLHCQNCYPLCNDMTYNAKMTNTILSPGRHQTKLLNDVHIENQSALNVFFSNFGTIKLKQDVVYRWYELLGDASGIGGIFVGFSLIAVVEFVYFVGLFVFELLKGPDSSDAAEDESGRKRAPIQVIYWGELYPRTRPALMPKRRDNY
ncbi:pickpocket protein 28-like isoform X2 [Nomia melanderi]|uniref:pickpocket protein 28-like isoform X2 n=1 Tax=Nomia melanderi TaxID=2448451 RepID=UPI003FCC2C19